MTTPAETRRPQSAEDCARLIEATYGSAGLDDASVLHVTAVWADPSEPLVTLRIGPETPRSARDRFALGLARARCDAILTTGRILREEPRLLHRYLDDAPGERALAAWRRAASGRATRPETAVLTGGHVDFGHPLFCDGAPVTIFTGQTAAAALRAGAPPNVRVVGDPDPGPRRVVEFLRGEGRSVSVEAGASTSAALYEPPALVEELMLSTFLAERLPDSVRGPHFELRGAAEAGLRLAGSCEIREPSGPWRFARYRVG